MIRAALREIGLAAVSLILSVLGMTAIWFALAGIGLVDLETGMYSSLLIFYGMPFAIGAGALFALLRRSLLDQRPTMDGVSAALIIGLIVCIVLGFTIGDITWVAFFVLPGFALWGALSGWFANRRRARGVSR